MYQVIAVNMPLLRLALSPSYGKHASAMASLESIIWPGGAKSAPKGWVVSRNGNRLKIGVPIKNGFRQFVTVTQRS